MNTRLKLVPIRDRIITSIADAAVLVSTYLDREYMNLYGKQSPAVWIVGQRLSPKDSGQAYTHQMRQDCTVDVAVRVLTKRYATEFFDAEQEMNSLHDKVVTAMLGWQHPDASEPFAWASAMDGPPYEAMQVQDLIFRTMTTYRKDIS